MVESSKLDRDYVQGISLIVVNYRTYGDLKRFVQSYEEFLPKIPTDLTIFNVSPDVVSHEYASDLEDYQYLWDEENIGYAAAVNRSVAQTDRELIGIFNADTYFTSNILDEIYGQLALHPDRACAGPKQVDSENKITHAGIVGDESHPNLRGWHQSDRGQYTEVEECLSVSGSAYFVKRSAWNEMMACPVYVKAMDALGLPVEGAFLPTKLFYEETWNSYHLRAHGHKVFYLGNVTMVHKFHQAIKNITAGAGYGDNEMKKSKPIFDYACESHGIAHD